MILIDVTVRLHDGQDLELSAKEYADGKADLRGAVERAVATLVVRLDEVEIVDEA